MKMSFSIGNNYKCRI